MKPLSRSTWCSVSAACRSGPLPAAQASYPVMDCKILQIYSERRAGYNMEEDCRHPRALEERPCVPSLWPERSRC